MNWPAYNAALKRRVDFTMWFSEDAIGAWRLAKTGARRQPTKYSHVAIETALFMRQVLQLALRQTEGFINSLARVLKVEISIPDFSCISKRSIGLPRRALRKVHDPGSFVIVDSTGRKVCGRDEWHKEKYDVAARRIWRNLHLAIDEHHQVLACALTAPDVGDTTVVPDLLDQITTTPFQTFMGDGAYDGALVAQAVLAKQPDAQVIIPPHKSAVFSATGTTGRDQHIETVAQQGRAIWQRIAGYNFRSYVELAMQLYKRIFGNTMNGRALARQKMEAWISASH